MSNGRCINQVAVRHPRCQRWRLSNRIVSRWIPGPLPGPANYPGMLAVLSRQQISLSLRCAAHCPAAATAGQLLGDTCVCPCMGVCASVWLLCPKEGCREGAGAGWQRPPQQQKHHQSALGQGLHLCTQGCKCASGSSSSERGTRRLLLAEAALLPLSSPGKKLGRCWMKQLGNFHLCKMTEQGNVTMETSENTSSHIGPTTNDSEPSLPSGVIMADGAPTTSPSGPEPACSQETQEVTTPVDIPTTTEISNKEDMYRTFHTWALRNYGDSGKTKTVTRRKYGRIVNILTGEEAPTADNSKFRFWVKGKGFQLSHIPGGRGGAGGEQRALYVPSREKVSH